MARTPGKATTAGDGEALRSRLDAMRGEFDNACAFTEELLRENESLRERVSNLMRKRARGGTGDEESVPDQAGLQERVRDLERERDDLRARQAKVEEMNRSFCARCEEIEAQHNHLANLYVASHQLHATLEFGEVVATLKEILINLVGAEAFALYWVEEQRGTLRTEASEGTEGRVQGQIRFEGDPLSSAVRQGQSYYADPLPARSEIDPARPIACIPLRIGDRVIGVVAIYRLFQQKDRFTPADFELFTLLAGHASTALFASKLFQQSEQKLTNLQGFINMLTASSG
jgi:GAF domain-containing protein